MEFRVKSISRFLGFLMVYSVNLLIVKTLYYEISSFKIFILGVVIWLFVYTCISYHNYLKKIRVLFISIIIFLLFSLLPHRILEILFFTRQDILETLKNTSDLINGPRIIEFALWSVKYIFGYTNVIPKSFDMVLLIIMFTLVSVLFANLIMKKRRFIYFIVPTGFFIFEWFRYVEGIPDLFNIYVLGLILYYIFINYHDKVSRLNKKNLSFKYYDYKSIMCFSSIMVIVIIITSNVIINALSLSIINDKMSNMFPSILELRSEYKRGKQSKFNFENTLYQPLGNRLGGSIDKRDILVMRVQSNRPLLYLRGRMKNIYTGYSWYSSNDHFDKSTKKSLKMDEVSFKGDMETVKVTIYPDNILTSTVFAPYFPIEIDANRRKVKYNSDLEMYFVKGFLKGNKGAYTIKSILPKNKNGEINIIDGRSIEKDEYLGLPDDMPDRISKLANDLTKDYEGQYEKMKTLERYLADNYFYSLTVSDIPEGRDFVDYFLFDDKNGYCTYYASSLAVMGRTLGIPTRYVEGFILPEKRGEDGLYEVKLEKSHAWVEAYIDGIGWVNFEPTSPYYIAQVEEKIEEDSQNQRSFENQEFNDTRYRDLRRMMEEEDIPFIEGDFDFTLKENNIDISKLILLFILIVTSLRILYLWYRNKRVFSKTDYRKYMIKNYYIIISLYSFIEKMDFKRYSPFQVMKMIDKKLVHIDISDDIIENINKAFYSNETVNEEDIDSIEGLREQVENEVIRRIGRIAYFYHKYVLGDLIYRKGDVYGTLWKNTSP